MTIYHVRFLTLYALVLFCSCSKPNDNPAPSSPSDADSLLSWKAIGSIPTVKGANDIWFTSPSKGFVAARDGYLYRTLDSGKTWIQIPNSASLPMINLFFANDRIGFAQSNNQLQVTKDGGDTWSLLQLHTSSAASVFFSTPSTGYLGDYGNGAYKTIDTGKTWQFNAQPGIVNCPAFFLTPDKGFLLYGDGTLLKTVDGGANWQKLTQVVFAPIKNQDTVPYNTLQFPDSLTGYIACKSGVLKTTDGGLSWNNVYPAGGIVNIIKFFTANLGYFKSDYAIYKTTDGGQTWATSCKCSTDDNFQGMFFINSSTGWACTLKGSILRMTPQ